MRIEGHEFQFLHNRAYASVRTKLSKERIGDGSCLIPLAKNMRLAAGDHIIVQVMNGDTLLSEAEFVVTTTAVDRKIMDDGNTQRTVQSRTLELTQCRDWWDNPDVYVPKVEHAETLGRPVYASDSNWTAEHAGRGRWRVKDGAGEIVASGLDEDEARAVARGDRAVPEAA